MSPLHKQLLDQLAAVDQLHGSATGAVKGLMRINAEFGVETRGKILPGCTAPPSPIPPTSAFP
jgi:hypothetical protein